MLLDNGLPIDAATAQGLYVGILTDTGQFRFNSTSRRTFLLAAELLARGADPAEAGYELYERETAGKLQLLQRFLASLRFECGGRVCIGLLPDGVFADTGTTPEDTEGMVDYARAIDGVDIGVLIEERPDGIKASLRAKDPAYRLDLVAAQFNGGGHACAAGLNLKGETLGSFYPRLVAALAERCRQGELRTSSDRSLTRAVYKAERGIARPSACCIGRAACKVHTSPLVEAQLGWLARSLPERDL